MTSVNEYDLLTYELWISLTVWVTISVSVAVVSGLLLSVAHSHTRNHYHADNNNINCDWLSAMLILILRVTVRVNFYWMRVSVCGNLNHSQCECRAHTENHIDLIVKDDNPTLAVSH